MDDNGMNDNGKDDNGMDDNGMDDNQCSFFYSLRQAYYKLNK